MGWICQKVDLNLWMITLLYTFLQVILVIQIYNFALHIFATYTGNTNFRKTRDCFGHPKSNAVFPWWKHANLGNNKKCPSVFPEKLTLLCTAHLS